MKILARNRKHWAWLEIWAKPWDNIIAGIGTTVQYDIKSRIQTDIRDWSENVIRYQVLDQLEEDLGE